MSASSGGSYLHWIARVADPGGVVWRTSDAPLGLVRRPLLGLPDGDGVLAGWCGLASEPQGLVSAYDGSGMLRWETTLDEPDGWDIAFVHARVAGGQESVVATHTELTSGSERVTVWRIDAEGKVVDTRVLAEGDNLLPGRHVVITSDGTIVLGSFAGSPDWIYVYAPSGELRWDKTLPDTQALYDLDSASDGSIYTISSFDDGGQALEHLVERYAPDGAHVQSWVHEATSPDSLPGSAFLAVDRRDDIHVAGNYRRGTEVSLRLAKYSPEGELRWSLPWEVNPATGDELAAHDLIIAANGDALLTFDNPTEEHPDRCHIVAVAP